MVPQALPGVLPENEIRINPEHHWLCLKNNHKKKKDSLWQSPSMGHPYLFILIKVNLFPIWVRVGNYIWWWSGLTPECWGLNPSHQSICQCPTLSIITSAPSSYFCVKIIVKLSHFNFHFLFGTMIMNFLYSPILLLEYCYEKKFSPQDMTKYRNLLGITCLHSL